jgi:hypothetical protein
MLTPANTWDQFARSKVLHHLGPLSSNALEARVLAGDDNVWCNDCGLGNTATTPA